MPAYQIKRVVTRLGNQAQKANPAFATEAFLDEPGRRANELGCNNTRTHTGGARAATCRLEHHGTFARGSQMKRQRQTCDSATDNRDIDLGPACEGRGCRS